MQTDDVLHMDIRRAYAGLGRAYVYVLFSKRKHVLYVGQTNDTGGVCARLAGHLGENGTFRVRLWERRGIEINEVDDLELFAFALPAQPEYTSRDEVYREGVEYCVQTLLHTVSGQWQPHFYIISNIQAPMTTAYPEVVSLGAEIFDTLENLYRS